MTDLNEIIWKLDANAGHWLTDDELAAVTDWMDENNLHRATAERPIVVEHGTVTYGQDRSDSTVRAPHRDIVMVTALLRTEPPEVWRPTCGLEVMAGLHEVFRHHEWSSGYDGVCVDCSDTSIDKDGRVWCRREDAAPWPCPPVRAAMIEAGVPVPSSNPHWSPRILGDCLSATDNAKIFD